MYVIVCTYSDEQPTVIGPFSDRDGAEAYAFGFDAGVAEVEIVELIPAEETVA